MNCCEKCIGAYKDADLDNGICRNGLCPCHAPSHGENILHRNTGAPTVHGLIRSAEEVDKIVEDTEWENTFSEKLAGWSKQRGVYDSDELVDDLILYIRFLLTRQKEVLREKVEGLKKPKDYHGSKQHAYSWNAALTEVLKLLK